MVKRVHPAHGRSDLVRRNSSRIVAILLAASLGACALIDQALAPPEPEPTPVEAEAPPAVVEPALPRAPRPRPARVARLPSPTERAQPQSAAPQLSEPEPAPIPDIKLVGMSRGEAATLLGTPAEERDAAPAKIWRYAGAECAVDLYFYLDVARNDFYALHYNVHDSNGTMAGDAADRCLQRIYSEKHK